jgi:hypothetical protein
MTAVTRLTSAASAPRRAVARLRRLDAWCGSPLWAGSNLERMEAGGLQRLTTGPVVGPALEAALEALSRRDEARQPQPPPQTTGPGPAAAWQPGPAAAWQPDLADWGASPNKPSAPGWAAQRGAPRSPRLLPAGEGCERRSRRAAGPASFAPTGSAPTEGRGTRHARGAFRLPGPAHWLSAVGAPGRRREPSLPRRGNWAERLSTAARAGAATTVRPARPGGRFGGRWPGNGPSEALHARAGPAGQRWLSGRAAPTSGPAAAPADAARQDISQPHELQVLVARLGSRSADGSAGAPSVWEPNGTAEPHAASWPATGPAQAHGAAPRESPASRVRPATRIAGGQPGPAVGSAVTAAEPDAAGGWLSLGQLGPALEQLLRDEARRYGIEPQDG